MAAAVVGAALAVSGCGPLWWLLGLYSGFGRVYFWYLGAKPQRPTLNLIFVYLSASVLVHFYVNFERWGQRRGLTKAGFVPWRPFCKFNSLCCNGNHKNGDGEEAKTWVLGFVGRMADQVLH
eukprot:1325512-Amphidinium_carterae.1